MDLLRQLRHVRRHWWVVLVTVMVALGVSAFLTVRAQPRYVASVTFFVTTPNQGSRTPTRADSSSSSVSGRTPTC